MTIIFLLVFITSVKLKWVPSQASTLGSIIIFSLCQQNLIKTSHNETNTPLITEIFLNLSVIVTVNYTVVIVDNVENKITP